MTKTQKITRTALLIAILFVIQYFKNISAYISGPIVNTILLIATFYIGIPSGILLSIIAPVSSYFIAGGAAMTFLMTQTKFTALPIIIIGNIIYVLFSAIIYNQKNNLNLILGLTVSSVLKWLFMFLSADFIIKPLFEENLGEKIAILGKIFGTLQLYAAIVGSIIFYLIFKIITIKSTSRSI